MPLSGDQQSSLEEKHRQLCRNTFPALRLGGRRDRLESEMMDLFFDVLESRVTAVRSELMSLPQHTLW